MALLATIVVVDQWSFAGVLFGTRFWHQFLWWVSGAGLLIAAFAAGRGQR
jgi:uncharacterized membrane protein